MLWLQLGTPGYKIEVCSLYNHHHFLRRISNSLVTYLLFTLAYDFAIHLSIKKKMQGASTFIFNMKQLLQNSECFYYTVDV